MIKKTTQVTLAAILLSQLLNSEVLAENSRHKAIIKKIKNQVEFKYDANTWNQAKLNQVIIPVTSIRTGPASRAEIMFSDGTATRVGSSAFFTFLDKQNRAVNVQSGKVWFNVKKKSYGLKIYSANAVALITGTEGFVDFSGSIKQENETYTVKTGDTLTKIAKTFLGDKATGAEAKSFIQEILDLNPIIIKNRNLVYPGDKIIIKKTTNITLDKSDSSFSLGLIEGTSDVYKADSKGELSGEAQKVKEGEVLTLKGGNFSRKNISDMLNIPKDMVIVQGSSFQMGGNGESDEKPVHDVNIGSFYLSKYEVTQSDYKSLMGNNPSRFTGDNLPVETVSWWDAIKYCNKKSLEEKLPIAYNETTGELLDADGKPTKDIAEVIGYRLPTEAEWEYATKGANKSQNYLFSGSNNPESVAWFGYDASGNTTHAIGSKTSNEIGLFDMSGNVSEWVSDSYISDAYNKINSNNNTNPYFAPLKPDAHRVYRGGSWDYLEMYQRVFTRSGTDPNYKGENIGFRIAKNITF